MLAGKNKYLTTRLTVFFNEERKGKGFVKNIDIEFQIIHLKKFIVTFPQLEIFNVLRYSRA